MKPRNRSDGSRNGTVRTPNNALLRKTRISAKKKLSKSTFSIVQEINENLAKIEGVFIQEKKLNFSKNRESLGVLTCSTPVPLFSALRQSWKPLFHNHGENQQSSSHLSGQNGFEASQNYDLQQCHYLTCLAVPLKPQFTVLVFI